MLPSTMETTHPKRLMIIGGINISVRAGSFPFWLLYYPDQFDAHHCPNCLGVGITPESPSCLRCRCPPEPRGLQRIKGELE